VIYLSSPSSHILSLANFSDFDTFLNTRQLIFYKHAGRLRACCGHKSPYVPNLLSDILLFLSSSIMSLQFEYCVQVDITIFKADTEILFCSDCFVMHSVYNGQLFLNSLQFTFYVAC